MSLVHRSSPRVVVIAGPTGTGKTQLALKAVREFGGEIINADSVQVFRGLDIGAAKPSASEMRQCPHHLYSHRPEGSSYTAGDYRRDALQVLEERRRAGTQNFFVVGGSGFYIQALLKGMYPVPPSNPEVKAKIRKNIEQYGLSWAFQELKDRDPLSAQRIGPNDEYRLVRALDVLLSGSHKTLEEVRQSFQVEVPPFLYTVIGLQRRRGRLRDILNTRAAQMISIGLLEEVQALLHRGFRDWPPLSSVGYREALSFLDGQIASRGDLQEAIVQSSMKLAKKQTTWFRRDESVCWFDPDHSKEAPLSHIEEFLESPRRSFLTA